MHEPTRVDHQSLLGDTESPTTGAASLEPADAIEVAARRGDAIVSVHYLTAPRGPAARRNVRLLAGAGAAMLLVSALAFAHGVSVAADNHAAQQAWLAAGHPVMDFRPKFLSPAFDVLSFGGLLGGLTLLGAALAARRAAADCLSSYRIGTAAGVELPLDHAPSASFGLVDHDGERFILRVTEPMHTELTVGHSVAAVTGSRTVALVPGTAARVTCGPVDVYVRPVAAARAVTGGWSAIESRPLAYGFGSALAHALALLLAWAIPPEVATAPFDFASGDDVLFRNQLDVREPPIEEPPPPGEAGGEPGADTGTSAEKGEAGAMGTANPRDRRGRRAIKQVAATPQDAMTRAEAIVMAQRGGILGAFTGADPFQTITGTADYSSGMDLEDGFGAYTGDAIGDELGWGTGIRGTGPAGGGNTIGTGPYPGYGKYTGCGVGVNCTGPGPRLRRRHKRRIHVDIPPPTVFGEYDGELIRRAVRRQRDRIRYCYERQLQVEPDLEGTVRTEFLINGTTGTVTTSVAKGLGSKIVETCVADAIAKVRLPRLDGGGMHRVRYPITFRPAR